MSEPFRCWLPGEPVPQARPCVVVGRRGGVHAFTPAKSAAYREKCALLLRRESCGEPAMTGPVSIDLVVYRARPASNKHERPDVRPDLDNYVKQVIDALVQAGVIADDGQVCVLTAAKHWSENYRVDGPGAQVTVKRLD